MTKAEELINKHLDKLDANNIIGKDGNVYKGFLNAVNEALNIGVVESFYCDQEISTGKQTDCLEQCSYCRCK